MLASDYQEILITFCSQICLLTSGKSYCNYQMKWMTLELWL